MLECEGNGLDALLDDEDDDLLSSLPLDDPSASNADTSVVTQKGAVVSDPAPHASAHSVGAVPQQFAFPFEPYDIQVGFMKALYQSLDAGKIGIFESPTGTGKSLSLICGALTWLQQYEERQRTEFELLMRQQPPSATKTKADSKGSKGQQPSELDWIQEFSEKLSKEEETKQLRLQQEALLEKERKLEDLRNNIQPRRGKRKREKLDRDFEELLKGAPEALQAEYTTSLGDQGETTEELADDSHLVVADYNSDDAADDGSQSDPEEEEHHVTKIYYCSRTHSQLSQFVKEIIKSPFGENTRVVSLGSRQNMCINEAVKKLKSLSLINDKCLDLQKNKKGGDLPVNEGKTKRRKSEGTCPFYKHEQLINYRDRILVEVNDIEQLVSLGKQGRACPYYGSRFAIPTAQVVALPYNTLLHKSTREACGIKLPGNVVIIDEAHNLLETINSIHSVEVWGAQLTQAHCQLSQYYDRYRSRLKASNLLYIKQLLFVLQGFLAALGGKPGIAAEQQKLLDQDASTKLVTINDFLFQSNLDNVNLFKVKRYCERSQISKKLNGFVEKYQPQVLPKVEVKKREEGASSGVSRFLQEIVLQQNTKDNTKRVEDVVPTTTDGQKETYGSVRSPLMHIEGFLEALTNADKDGRVVINRQNVLSRSSVKFLLLNPAVHFVNIVKEARAVVVAGGTMQPVSEFKDQLFHAVGVSPDRILEYSCGHVIPGEQLLPLALARGPTGIDLDFTFQSRNSPQLLDDAGRLMVNVCNIVPGGIVVFFPSYDYQRVVYSHWEKTGFLRKIGLKKKVFQEPRSAGQVELVLSQYTEAVRGKSCPGISGAVLFCVVGGKMSEGINFADEMGRSVIMVGLPYPNMYSPELKEKMSYLNANFPRSSDGRLPGQVHYENLCMKAVNQSIGRAIRHKNDYASILLLDQRYLRGNVVSKLPAWIAKYLLKMDRFGPAFGALSKFFIGKRAKLSNT